MEEEMANDCFTWTWGAACRIHSLRVYGFYWEGPYMEPCGSPWEVSNTSFHVLLCSRHSSGNWRSSTWIMGQILFQTNGGICLRTSRATITITI